MVVAVLAVIVMSAVVQEAARHPVADGVVGLLLLGGAVFGVLRRRVLWERRRLEVLHQQEIQLAQSREIARYHAMSFSEFEHALAFLCQRDGCTGVQVVGGAGDMGADVVACAPDGGKIVLQAKRYGPTNKVSSPELQKFGGTCFMVHNANIAAVVTTSRFTEQARKYASHMNILLVDEHGLAAWASGTGPPPWR
jgi:restriction system protein